MGADSSLPKPPNDKKTLKISDQGLDAFPFSITDDSKVRTIEASKNKLKTFPLNLKNVQSIDISENDLKEILEKNPDVVVNFPELKTLKLSDCNIQSMPKWLLSLKDLKELILDKNYLEKLEIPYEKIEILDVFINKLTSLPPLPDTLIKFNAGFNMLSEVSFSLTNVVDLRLQGNLITYVSPDISFPKVKLLDLSHNHICEMPPIAKLAPNVEMLQLTFNFLVVAPTDLPESLVKYDISYNMISHIDAPLDHLKNLTHLDVSNNLLDELPKLPVGIKTLFTEHNKFKKVCPIENTSVKLITFYESELEELPDMSKTNMQTFVVSHNKIRDLQHPERLPGQLKQLEVMSNKLSIVNTGFFLLNKLKSLILTNNDIKEIPPEIERSKLHCLMLGENPISSLPPLPKTLKVISCANCKFTAIPDAILELKELQHVDFSCNQLTSCPTLNCNFVSVNCNNIKTLHTISPQTVCFLAAHNKIKEVKIVSLKYMAYFDLSHNDIRELKLIPTDSLKALKLEFNPQLKGVIDFANYPKLEQLDVVGTKLTYINNDNNKKILEIAQDYDKNIVKQGDVAIKHFSVDSQTGYFEFVGIRPAMEDAIIIRNLSHHAKFLGVLDGHGGNRAATIGAYFIPLALSKLGAAATLNDIQPVLYELNNRLKQLGVHSGATAVFALVRESEVSIAHLGDARAIIVKEDGSMTELTVDHKATDRMEFDLLKEKRCFLALGRVNGTLAVSRTIGDCEVEGVLRSPSLTTYQLQPGDKRLLLACDGIFDVFSSAEAAAVAMSEKDPARAASKLVSLAYSRGSQDNMSVLIYDFQQQSLFSKFSSLF